MGYRMTLSEFQEVRGALRVLELKQELRQMKRDYYAENPLTSLEDADSTNEHLDQVMDDLCDTYKEETGDIGYATCELTAAGYRIKVTGVVQK